MQTQISIGSNRNFTLSQALLICKGDSHKEAFVTLHQIGKQAHCPPTLGPAETLTHGFLDSLIHAVGGNAAVEVLPENILARTQDMLAWWVPAKPRRMFSSMHRVHSTTSAGRSALSPPLCCVWMDRACPCERWRRTSGRKRAAA